MISEHRDVCCNTSVIHKDSNNRHFRKLEEKIVGLSNIIATQCQGTECVEESGRCLANQNWLLGRSVERLEKRVEESERELLSAKETINKLCVDLCELNIHIVEVQEKLKDVESKNSLTEMHIHAHNTSLCHDFTLFPSFLSKF